MWGQGEMSNKLGAPCDQDVLRDWPSHTTVVQRGLMGTSGERPGEKVKVSGNKCFLAPGPFSRDCKLKIDSKFLTFT